VIANILYMSIARYDVSFNNFLQVVENVITDLKLGADGSSYRFITLLDINMHKISLIEFPSQSEIIVSFRRRSEKELSNLLIS